MRSTVVKHHPVGDAADATVNLGDPNKLRFAAAAPADLAGPTSVMGASAQCAQVNVILTSQVNQLLFELVCVAGTLTE